MQLPGIDGTMSVNFLFILLGVLEFESSRNLADWLHGDAGAERVADPQPVGSGQNIVQRGWHDGQCQRPCISYHWLAQRYGANKPILLMVAALVFFFANTLPISIVISLTEGKSSRKVWSEC